MTISSHFLSFLVFGSCIASLAFGGPTSDVHLTEENALDGDQLDFHEFHPTPQKMAEDVAGAFVKGLEDSIAGIADILTTFEVKYRDITMNLEVHIFVLFGEKLFCSFH